MFLHYADNLALPLALLADNTFLPFAVDILFLNPCTLALCLVLGWKVIFPLCIRTPPFYSVWHKPPIVSPGIIRPYPKVPNKLLILGKHRVYYNESLRTRQ